MLYVPLWWAHNQLIISIKITAFYVTLAEYILLQMKITAGNLDKGQFNYSAFIDKKCLKNCLY